MDLRKLKTLIDLVSESNVSELEITEAEGKVRIVKANTGQVSMQTMQGMGANLSAATIAAINAQAMQPMQPNFSNTGAFQAALAPTGTAPAAEAEAAAAAHVLKSPMVGTLYLAPNPTSKPFFSVGDAVKEGETICIIEAMKILNEIEADKTGTVKRVFGENGQAVEFGQPLFEIE
jgi:acetyl-CoA carboxylase biotin carboxyl carrier protein